MGCQLLAISPLVPANSCGSRIVYQKALAEQVKTARRCRHLLGMICTFLPDVVDMINLEKRFGAMQPALTILAASRPCAALLTSMTIKAQN